MKEIQYRRKYRFHGIDLEISCSPAVAECLDQRFRLLPAYGDLRGSLSFDFQSVVDGSHHAVKKPEDQGRVFYHVPSGEACYFGTDDRLYLSFRDGVRALGRPGLGCASFSVVESNPVNLFMASHLMLTIVLVEMLKRRGYYSMHAAAFSKENKAILISGTSGAGKSTLAITLLRGGFGYLSDDMVFLQRRSGDLEVLGFQEDVDVSDQTIGFFPELDFLGRAPRAIGWPKKQVLADEVYRAELVEKAQPRVLIIPQIAHRATSAVRPIDADEALLEVVSNVLLTEGHACQNHLDILTQLVKQTPCYRLETGHDFDRIPRLLGDLLRGSREEIHA